MAFPPWGGLRDDDCLDPLDVEGETGWAVSCAIRLGGMMHVELDENIQLPRNAVTGNFRHWGDAPILSTLHGLDCLDRWEVRDEPQLGSEPLLATATVPTRPGRLMSSVAITP